MDIELKSPWKDVKRKPPKCGQTVLGLLDWGDRGLCICPIYVVKVGRRRRFGHAPYCGSGMQFSEYDAKQSFPEDDCIIGWADPKELAE